MIIYIHDIYGNHLESMRVFQSNDLSVRLDKYGWVQKYLDTDRIMFFVS